MTARSTITAMASAAGARLYAATHRNPPIDRLVVDLADLRSQDRVLDIGCGAGAAVQAAARSIGGRRIAATDPSPTMVRIAARRVPQADVRIAPAECAPFADDTFTVVWAVQSVHHWTDVDRGLAEIRRILAAGGRMLLAERVNHARWAHGTAVSDLYGLRTRVRRAGLVDTGLTVHRVSRRDVAVVHGVAPVAGTGTVAESS
jgi:ubiquinone/menaquinone biosynthesis C-methylase UbiE